MDARARTPIDLFDLKLTYEIPTFQRPYVWNEEDQWQPLWDDVARAAEAVLDADGDDEVVARIAPHFLGAVVIKHLTVNAGEIQRYWVIDGQQRLTTLQLLLDAAALIVSKAGREADAERLSDLILNDGKRFHGKPERFKILPSKVDRAAFVAAMDDDRTPDASTARARIVLAHEFFAGALAEWAGAEAAEERLGALTHVLCSKLAVVSILLGEFDDEQLIFETINDRGTPLLGADLIKNFIFRTGDDLHADVDRWNEDYWGDLDDEWWREQVSQGRLYRSRIDMFVQYWLAMRTHEEVPAEQISARFQRHARRHLVDRDHAETFLAELRRDADTFREFAQMSRDTARGRFYSVVIESLELGATTPLLLWLISRNHDVPAAQIDRALAAVESWVVRRMLLRRTTQSVNQTTIALLARLDEVGAQRAGDATVEFLADQTSHARAWPGDRELLDEVPRLNAYGTINQGRLRLVLAAVEQHWRSARHEDVSLPGGLQIEHVMPRRWDKHWGADIAGDAEAADRRTRLVDTLGNLTLVTQKLNGTLSNQPWSATDGARGKRALLADYSLLVLNKKIITNDRWTEDDIAERGRALTEAVIEMWPRPARG